MRLSPRPLWNSLAWVLVLSMATQGCFKKKEQAANTSFRDVDSGQFIFEVLTMEGATAQVASNSSKWIDGVGVCYYLQENAGEDGKLIHEKPLNLGSAFGEIESVLGLNKGKLAADFDEVLKKTLAATPAAAAPSTSNLTDEASLNLGLEQVAIPLLKEAIEAAGPSIWGKAIAFLQTQGPNFVQLGAEKGTLTSLRAAMSAFGSSARSRIPNLGANAVSGVLREGVERLATKAADKLNPINLMKDLFVGVTSLKIFESIFKKNTGKEASDENVNADPKSTLTALKSTEEELKKQKATDGPVFRDLSTVLANLEAALQANEYKVDGKIPEIVKALESLSKKDKPAPVKFTSVCMPGARPAVTDAVKLK